MSLNVLFIGGTGNISLSCVAEATVLERTLDNSSKTLTQ